MVFDLSSFNVIFPFLFLFNGAGGQIAEKV